MARAGLKLQERWLWQALAVDLAVLALLGGGTIAPVVSSTAASACAVPSPSPSASASATATTSPASIGVSPFPVDSPWASTSTPSPGFTLAPVGSTTSPGPSPSDGGTPGMQCPSPAPSTSGRVGPPTSNRPSPGGAPVASPGPFGSTAPVGPAPARLNRPSALTGAGTAVASPSFSLAAATMATSSLVYEGTTTLNIPGGGTETVLEFSAASVDLNTLDMKLGCGGSYAIATLTAPGQTAHATTVHLDVLELKATSPAIDFTPASPPPGTAPVALGNLTLTGLTATTGFLHAASISGPLQVSRLSC